VYALNQVFLSFVFAFGDKINFDVHPFAGRVGMDGYDHYPLFSAFLMAFHKYGIFSLYAIYAWRANLLATTEEEERRNAKFPLLSNGNQLIRGSKVSDWLTDHASFCIALLFSMTNLGTYLMWWIVTKHHPTEQATASTLLIGIMGIIFSSFQVIYDLFHAKNQSSKLLDEYRSV
jgi:predicted MFS family arabinose efflux permease